MTVTPRVPISIQVGRFPPRLLAEVDAEEIRADADTVLTRVLRDVADEIERQAQNEADGV